MNRGKKSPVRIILAALLATMALLFFLLSVQLKSPGSATGEKTADDAVRENNAACLECHATHRFQMPDPDDPSEVIYRRLPRGDFIDTNKYYLANHSDFACTDCHSDEYETYPHDANLKLVALNVCLDCHEDYDATAHYRFENIAEAFRTNVHYLMDSLHFNCWQCHDAHYNKAHFRDSLQPLQTHVDYANAFCLKCHDPETQSNRYAFFGGTEINLVEKHDWMHKPEHHLQRVRCIDCHAAVDDSVLVSHAIMPKESSVRECSACHSGNSLLAQNLFKNRLSADAVRCGFGNPAFMDDHYVIGANRNATLVSLLAVLMGALLLFIATHIVLRVINRK